MILPKLAGLVVRRDGTSTAAINTPSLSEGRRLRSSEPHFSSFHLDGPRSLSPLISSYLRGSPLRKHIDDCQFEMHSIKPVLIVTTSKESERVCDRNQLQKRSFLAESRGLLTQPVLG